MTRENLSACKAFVDFWDDHGPCDHSQRSGLLQTSKPPEKAADGNVPHVRRLQRFQNPYDDDAREHGTQVWSYGRTSEQPFCAQGSRFIYFTLFTLKIRNPRLQRSFGLAIVLTINANIQFN